MVRKLLFHFRDGFHFVKIVFTGVLEVHFAAVFFPQVSKFITLKALIFHTLTARFSYSQVYVIPSHGNQCVIKLFPH